MRYLFFISWLKTREKKLADQIDFDRMINASSLEESFKVLNDTDYAPYIANKSYLDVEEVIKEEREGLKKSLKHMGMDQDLLDFLFSRDEIFALGRRLKEGEEIDDYQEIVKEIKERNPQTAKEIDDFLVEIYFNQLIKFCLDKKEKETAKILKDYWQEKISNDDPQTKEDLLIGLEEEIIKKSKDVFSGVLPLLSFFIRKRKIDSLIRGIFSAKRIGLSSSNIFNLSQKTRAL